MIDSDKTTEMVIKAIEHCKTHRCNECPFEGYVSCCVAVLEYLIKSNEISNKHDMTMTGSALMGNTRKGGEVE